MPASNGWRDHTRDLPLRFGTHRARLRMSILLLFVGGIALQLTSAYTLALGVLGLAASLAGWCLVPSPGWRRTVAIAPAVLGVAGLLGGALSSPVIALTLAAWLLVRMRPAVSYLVLVLPVGVGVVLGQVFAQYGSGVIVVTVMGVVVVASAWLAWMFARSTAPRVGIQSRPSHSREMFP